jgi:RNA polymerase sigma-70 factor (ECF subfamily)
VVSDAVNRAKWIEEAVGRYERPLLRCALRLTGDLDMARDVVQDAFLRLCKADRAQVEGHLAAWLYTVCRNRALDVLRKEGRMGRLSDTSKVADTAADGGPQTDASAREIRELVLRVLGTLPEPQREAFRLKFQDELTYREISQVMGKSLGTVSKLVSSALAAVRDELGTRPEMAQEG